MSCCFDICGFGMCKGDGAAFSLESFHAWFLFFRISACFQGQSCYFSSCSGWGCPWFVSKDVLVRSELLGQYEILGILFHSEGLNFCELHLPKKLWLRCMCDKLKHLIQHYFEGLQTGLGVTWPCNMAVFKVGSDCPSALTSVCSHELPVWLTANFRRNTNLHLAFASSHAVCDFQVCH